MANVQRHEQTRCKYRVRVGDDVSVERVSPVLRVREEVVPECSVENDAWFDDDFACLSRERVSLNGLARDYVLTPSDVVYNVRPWFRERRVMVYELFDCFDDFCVKGRLVLRAHFVKYKPNSMTVIRREQVCIPSLPMQHIISFRDWYHEHTEAIYQNINKMSRQDSDFVFDGVDCLFIKFSLSPNTNAQAYFELPTVLRNKQAVINVDSPEACFKYALLSVLHYKDMHQHRQRTSKYETWEDELNF